MCNLKSSDHREGLCNHQQTYIYTYARNDIHSKTQMRKTSARTVIFCRRLKIKMKFKNKSTIEGKKTLQKINI